ncbi:hypothetical protein D3C76_1070710 [compost metagenome]
MGGLVVDGFHAFLVQRPGIFDLAVGAGLDDPAWRGGLHELGIVFGPVRAFRFFLGIEVIEVAEELIEAVIGRQVLVLVAQMVLAELAGSVALRLEGLGNGDITGLQADRDARHADLGQPGTQRRLTCDEGRAPRGAAVLRIVIGEHHAFLGDAVDVRCLVADDALAVGADVGLANIVAEDHQDVWLLRGMCQRNAHGHARGQGKRAYPPRTRIHNALSPFHVTGMCHDYVHVRPTAGWFPVRLRCSVTVPCCHQMDRCVAIPGPCRPRSSRCSLRL